MRRSRRRIVGQTAGVVVRRLAPLAVAVAVTSAASGLAACSSAESDGPPDVHFLAQCLNLSDTPMPPAVVCRVDGEGNVESTTSIELTSGQPFVTGPDNSHVAAVEVEYHRRRQFGNPTQHCGQARAWSSRLIA